jgi:hypothetical protein
MRLDILRSKDSDCGLLGWYMMQVCRWLPVFQRIQGMKMEAVHCSEKLVSHLLHYLVYYPQRPQFKQLISSLVICIKIKTFIGLYQRPET